VEAGDWEYEINVGIETIGYKFRFNNVVTVAEGETVQVDFATDSWIEIHGSVTGETIAGISGYMSTIDVPDGEPQKGFQVRPKSSFNYVYYTPGNVVRLPVLSGPYPYKINGNVRLLDLVGSMSISLDNAVINPSETHYSYLIVDPGYVTGKISILGGQLTSGKVTFAVSDSIGTVTGEGSCSLIIGEDGEYFYPMISAEYIKTSASIKHSGSDGSVSLEERVFTLPFSETVVNDWLLDLSSEIIVSTSIDGADLYKVQINAANPDNTGQSETTYEPTEPIVLNVLPGEWKMSSYAYEKMYEEETGYGWDGFYDFPFQIVDVPLGGQAPVNFNLNPGYLTGQIFHSESPIVTHARRIAYQIQNLNTYKTSWRWFTDDLEENDDRLGSYALIADEGLWRFYGIFCYLGFFDENGITQLPSLEISEPRKPVEDLFLPVMNVVAGETTVADAIFDPVEIKVRLRTSTGDLFSTPQVSGEYIDDPQGIYNLLKIKPYGESKAVEVSLADVVLYTLRGTYEFTGSGKINGVRTTFGYPFMVTADDGDVVEVDPDAPHVVINFPVGNYWSCSDTMVVSGTITDESGVASLTINSDEVMVEGDSFTHTLENLPVGENIIELIASDTEGNTVTINRTVFVDALPVAVLDEYEVQEDGLLDVPAPGVLTNDIDADGDILILTSNTEPAHGTVNAAQDGSFVYIPEEGFYGEDSFTYSVSDAGCQGSDGMVQITVIPNNLPPEVQPSPVHATVQVGIDPVHFAADVSDINGDTVTYQWLKDAEVLDSGSVVTMEGGASVMLPALNIPAGDPRFPVGQHGLELVVNDGVNDPVSSSVVVDVIDTEDPTLNPIPTAGILWPPDHELHPITIQANAFDNSGGTVQLDVTVVSSEPEDGGGDGTTSPDLFIDNVDNETGLIELRLRAERSGKNAGRTYTVTITATDEYGNASVSVLQIMVSHDNGKK
jgi:hypothetical protein